jgi:hypothetical protein
LLYFESIGKASASMVWLGLEGAWAGEAEAMCLMMLLNLEKETSLKSMFLFAQAVKVRSRRVMTMERALNEEYLIMI